MKASRTAHWPLLVPTLVLGMALGPAHVHAAPARPTGDAEAAPKGGGAEGETAPETEPGGAPKGGSAAKGKGGEAPKGGSAAKGKTGEAPKGESDGAAKVEPGAPTEVSPDGAPEDTEATPAGDPGASPDAGTTDAPDAGATSPEAEPTEPLPTEPTLEPEITVQPRPVEPALETSTVPRTAAREAVTDPRRLRSDDRIMFRAGILSLGVAAAAVVPTVIGFQQAYVAHEDDDPARERTMRGLGIGAGIAAGTYAITGAVLLALGARQRRAAVAPAVGPGQVGAVLRARF